MKSGQLLVEVARPQQAKSLLRTTKFFNLTVKVTAHSTLNSCKGIIRCPSLQKDTDEEILDYFKSKNQKVTHVRRIKGQKGW